jgi:hypothetical protein
VSLQPLLDEGQDDRDHGTAPRSAAFDKSSRIAPMWRVSEQYSRENDRRAAGRFLQRRAEESLEPNLVTIELRGAPSSLVWPPICANCGGGASERIRIRKAFYRRARWSRATTHAPSYKTVTVDIPFCHDCAERHRAEARTVSTFRRWRSFIFSPVHIATIGLTIIFFKMDLSWQDFQGLGPRGLWVATTPMIALALAIWLAFWYTRPDRFEPQTAITKACDFSTNVSRDFGPKRHIYSLRNKVFADAFIAANRDRIWTREDQERTSWRTAYLGAIFIGGLIVARLLMWYYTGK